MSDATAAPAQGADVLTKAITDLGEQITKQGEKFATKEDYNTLNKAFGDLKASITVSEPNSTKDKCHGYKHYGEFAQAVMKYGESHGRDADERIKAVLAKATTDEPFAVPQPPGFSPMIKAAGDGVTQAAPFQVGTLFKPQFGTTIGDAGWVTDSLVSRCRMVPIDASSESITLDYVDDANRTNGIKGGMSAYWKAELTQMTETKPKLRQIKLVPQELYAFAYASDKSLRNSPIALGSFLQSGMVEAVDFKIGDAIVNGDGAGKPLGLINSPDIISVAKETSQGAATITHANIAKMWKRMPAQWRSGAVWLANQDVEEALDRLAATVYKNDGTSLESADSPSVYNAEKNTIKARPIVFSEYCQTLGTTGDFFLWAPNRYLVAVKTGQGPEMSMHLKFDYAQTAFRFIFEIDGRSEFDSVLTPYKGSTTRSAIVKLDTRS